MEEKRIIAFMNSYSQGKSGGDRVFIEIAKKITLKKTIITSSLGKDVCERSDLNANFIITTREKEFKNIIFTYTKRIIKTYFQKIKIGSNDILLGTSDFLPDVLPIYRLKKKNRKIKWVQHIFHIIPSSKKISHFFQKISFYFIKKLADVIVIDNGLLKKELSSFGFDEKKIFVNYPGIDHSYLNSVEKNKEKYEGVFMAQLRVSKGIFELVDIWKLVCKEKPDAKLAIIGRGDENIINEIREKIKKENLEENIKILGYLPDEVAFSIVKSSKVFVFPSHEEGFGIAPLEAQVLGIPVIAWDLPVFNEVFKCGMIKLKMNNIKDFSDNVIKLLRDNYFYEIMSREAQKNASLYSWDSTAERELELIRETING